MPEPSAERTIHIRFGEDLHRRLRIRCAEFDTTIQDFVVELLEREFFTKLSGEGRSSRDAAPNRGRTNG